MPEPPVTITPNEASDLPPDTAMLASRGASDAPIPSDAMLPPTHQAEPQQYQPPPLDPSLTQGPSEPLPNTETHLSTLGNILGKVAGFLTGDDKWVVTRDADGNMRAEKQDMSTKEKWGRIAAAALGGAARGMAAGQGPGGMGRAIGAGFQGAVQDQQQAKQSAFSEADQANRELLFKANRASLLQDVVRKTMVNKEADAKASADEMVMTNKMLARLAAAPGATDAGIYQTPSEIYQIPYKHPELMNGHTDGVVEAYPVYNADHTIKGFQAYIVDKAWADQKTKEDRTFYEWKPNPDDPVNGRPVLQQRTIKAGQTTEGAYAQGMLNTVKTGLDYQKKYADIEKENRPPVAKSWQEAQAMADQETDPAKKAALQKTADDIYNKALKLKRTSAKEGSGTGAGGAGSDWSNPLKATKATTPAEGATDAGETGDQGSFLGQFNAPVSAHGQQILDSLPPGKAALVKRFGNYLADESKELPRGKER